MHNGETKGPIARRESVAPGTEIIGLPALAAVRPGPRLVA